MKPASPRTVTAWHLAFLLLCIWLGVVVFVLLRQASGLLTERDFNPNPWQPIRFITVYFWLPWFLLAPIVAWLAKRVPIRPERWLWPISANILTFLAISAVHALGVAYGYLLLRRRERRDVDLRAVAAQRPLPVRRQHVPV